MTERKIAYEDLKTLNEKFQSEIDFATAEVIKSGWFILGEAVRKFETAFSKYCDTKYTVGVANGLDALILSLKALNIGEGDEVIVPSNTYIATILSILHAGAKPVLCKPDIFTYNIDPAAIEEKITNRTRAIMVVHLYGKLCDMENIYAVANKYNLKIIEDCAQAHGASYKNRKAGSWGEAAAFSFYPTKNLGALGDAGAVCCSNDSLYQILRSLRNYGSDKKYYNDRIGYNSRLDELQAAVLERKLQSLDKLNNHKNNLASLYFNRLKEDFILPIKQKDFYDVFHIFPIRHAKRDALREYLLSKGIQTEIHYPVPPSRQKAMQGILDHQHCTIADQIHHSIMSLPISFIHSEDDIHKVIDACNTF